LKDNDRIRRAIVDKFRTIARERLEKLNLGVVQLERHPEHTQLSSDVIRAIHTL